MMEKMRIVIVVLSVALLSSAASAALTSFDIGFEDGTFGGLLGYNGVPASNQYEIETDPADPQGDPHSGQNYAKPTTGFNTWTCLQTEGSSLGFGTSGQGTLTAWFRINYHTADSAALLQVFGNGTVAYLRLDQNQGGKIYYQSPPGTSTGAIGWRDDYIGDDAWGKAHAVVDNTGTSLYLDDVLMGTNTALTSIDNARFGYNAWTTASSYNQVFLDDISWAELADSSAEAALSWTI